VAAAVSVFKLTVQIVCQLRQRKIEDFKVSFEMAGLPYQWIPVANYSILIARQCLARQCWSVLACVDSQYRTHRIIHGLRYGNLNISKVIF